MISFEEALEIMQNKIRPPDKTNVGILQSLNRILAEDVIADTDMPPFNKSAMDGYACRKTDINNTLDVIEEIPAGTIPQKKIGENQCSRIMTGAIVPEGADIVLMKEYTEVCAPNKIKCTNNNPAGNICYKGEDVKSGDIILKKGNILHPQHIAVLASAGCTNPSVYQLPSIAVLSTGNELVEPSQKPGLSQIRNSNGYQIMAQIAQMGLNSEYLGIAADNESALLKILTKAVSGHNLTVISGGVSVGDYDFIPKVLSSIGVKINFHGINARPGKHILFGEDRNHHYVVGLPGNPVSSFVQFEVLIRPFLYRLMGNLPHNIIIKIPLGEPYIRKKNDVVSFVPVTINNSEAYSLEYHGSAHIHAYTSASGIMEIPVGISELRKGEMVRVRPV